MQPTHAFQEALAKALNRAELFFHRLKLLSAPPMLAVAMAACSSNVQPHEGMIAVMNGQQKLITDKAEEERVCASTYCEPNFTVYAYFGRARRIESPAQPVPPTPAPNPVATPKPKPQVSNYSHNIMKVDQAWARTQGSAQVTVAVIDSGSDINHPLLNGRLSINTVERTGTSGQDDDGNGFVDDVYGYDFQSQTGNPIDQSGHGTHVAGIVSFVAPNVKILPLKFIGANGQGSTYNAIRAIDYAIARKVQVINASWGSGSYSQLLDQAIQRAINAGITFIAAAGNDGAYFNNYPNFPAAISGVISVAASNQYDEQASYSNYGSNITLTAPGDEINSSVPGGGLDYKSGTSMAAPQVAGTVALMKSLRVGSGTTEVTQHLCASADIHAARGSSRCGRMHTGRAVSSW